MVFPAAIAGLAVGLATGRREVAAGVAGVGIALAVGLAVKPRAAVLAGGFVGPHVRLLVPRRPSGRARPDDLPGGAGRVRAGPTVRRRNRTVDGTGMTGGLIVLALLSGRRHLPVARGAVAGAGAQAAAR